MRKLASDPSTKVPGRRCTKSVHFQQRQPCKSIGFSPLLSPVRTQLRFCGHDSFAPTSTLACQAAPFALEDAANGFVAEYDFAGLKLEPLAKQQLHAWYLAELQRTGPNGPPGGGSSPFKDLPPLTQQRRGVPQITVLWDLESVKPFTQQQQQQPPSGDSDRQAPRPRHAGADGRISRLAAAGLTGDASPDLIGALDQLCRTLQEYGTIHAVHLFLRESTLSKAPALRRQVEQLTRWAGQSDQEGGSGGGEGQGQGRESERYEGRLRSAKSGPGIDSAGSSGGREGYSVAGRYGGGPVMEEVARATAPHDCPLCRSAHASRLDLLRHFAVAHQAPLLAATASDARAHIMWTRGRPISLPAGPPSGTAPAASAAVEDDGKGDALPPQQERVTLNPQDFVYARELLMRGRHLDPLLAAAPPALHSIGTAGQAAAGAAGRAAQGREAGSGASGQEGRPGGGGGGGGGGGAAGAPGGAAAVGVVCGPWGPGLHLHVAPAGTAGEVTAAAVMRVAAEFEDAQAAPSPSPDVGLKKGGRADAKKGRERERERESLLPHGPPACLCVVGDGEGLDQALGGLQKRGLLVIAVTRVTKVPSAGASLRWWAVQSGEYRLSSGWRR